MKTVASRLESCYIYSADIVYNNFVCQPTTEQRKKIEVTTKKILDVLKNYLDATLADLYHDIL